MDGVSPSLYQVTLLQITKNRTAPFGEDGEVLLPRIKRIGRIVSYARLRARQKPNKPLGEDGGRCPGTQASALVLEEQPLSTQTENLSTTFLAEGHHPRQGDKQE